MAEKHDSLVSQYRSILRNRGYKIESRSPFVDYRPDIFATKGKLSVFVEAEIEATLHGNHTLHQLEILYSYLESAKQRSGVLVVPKRSMAAGSFLISSVFGDKRIGVVGL